VIIPAADQLYLYPARTLFVTVGRVPVIAAGRVLDIPRLVS
jgi:hypothetical protein